jgi:hypothetical protein
MPANDQELNGLLDKLREAKGKAQPAVSKEEAWVGKFEDLRRKVIRPMLETLGKQLQQRGHDFDIVQAQFQRENRAVPLEASIRIDLYLSTERTRTGIGRDRRPHLAFTTKHKSQAVEVTLCDITARGGVVSTIGEFPLEKIDTAFVRDKFVALLNRLVKQEGLGA